MVKSISPSQSNLNLSKEAINMRFMKAVDSIIYYRKLGCKSYSDVGKIIGILQQNFSKIRNNDQGPTPIQIAMLCEHFHINDSYILRGKGNIEDMVAWGERIDILENRVNELDIKLNVVLKSQKK